METTPAATPTPIQLEAGYPEGEDIEDVLLLYDSTQPQAFDINFCKVAEYYGLVCKEIAVDLTNITDDLLRDQQGNYFKLVGASATTLLQGNDYLSNKEITILKSAIN